MSLSHLVSYLATAAVVTLTPGPDMLLCIAVGLHGGPRAGLGAAAGVAGGEVVHIGAAAIGLAALLRSEPALFDGVRLLGAAYLILLGIRALRGSGRHLGEATAAVRGAPARRWTYVRRGFASNLLNPKMALFSLAFLPQFVDPGRGSPALQFALLGACFVALDFAVDGCVGMLAGRFRSRLRDRRAQHWLSTASGMCLLALGTRSAIAP
jgi:threonine/homoserine/homoserine lactone efflux protein